MAKINATFVSVWDNGSRTIESLCKFDPNTRKVTDIEMVEDEIEDLDVLDREYVELPDGTELDVEIDDLKIEGRENE
jgi:hypothetical protein